LKGASVKNSVPATGASSISRLQSFSDGVMAFAITLLALNIKIPKAGELGGGQLGDFLWRQWPAFLLFALSFVIIILVWANHQSLFRCFRQGDPALVLLNAAILMCVVLIPVSASLLAQALTGPPEDARLACLAYGGLFTVGSVFFNLCWWHGGRAGLLDPALSPARRRGLTRHFRMGPLLYGGATLCCFISVWLSFALFLAGIGRYLVTVRSDED
jgi:uncharacterized membrane protein